MAVLRTQSLWRASVAPAAASSPAFTLDGRAYNAEAVFTCPPGKRAILRYASFCPISSGDPERPHMMLSLLGGLPETSYTFFWKTCERFLLTADASWSGHLEWDGQVVADEGWQFWVSHSSVYDVMSTGSGALVDVQ